jgi:hypothetical protein
MFDKDDKLFTNEKSFKTGAWLQNPADKFYLYSEGYKQAGILIYNHVVNNPDKNNTLVYPIIYVFRQYAELQLKELITLGYRYLGLWDKTFPDSHDLGGLWAIYRKNILPQVDRSINNEILDRVECLIQEFHREDPNSCNFRYPVTKGRVRKPSLHRQTVDLETFMAVMKKLIVFFEWQWDMIAAYTDSK